MNTKEALKIATTAINPFREPISPEHLESYLYLQRYTASLILMRDKDLWNKPKNVVLEQHRRALKLYKTITRRGFILKPEEQETKGAVKADFSIYPLFIKEG